MMKATFQHILIPYNGTSESDKAFKKAVSLSSFLGAKTTVITFLEKRHTFAFFKFKTAKEEIEKEKMAVQKQHEKMVAYANDHHVECDSKVLMEKNLTSVEILEFAKNNDVDLIVMSKTRLSSPAEKLHYHSTLENVQKNAKCAVLILN